MQIWPAIDLLRGKCVRLQQGDHNRQTVFSEDPLEVAQRWKQAGAVNLHIVDLDGAKDGSLVNVKAIGQLVAASGLACQVGGGVRDEDSIERLLSIGVCRIVVGTRALQDPEWFASMADKYPNRLVVGIDARDGMVATHGWLETSGISAVSLAQRIANATNQVVAIVYTDIARDGMLAGPNFEQLAAMQQATSIPVVCSGGVTSIADIRRLIEMNTEAAILGRAIYEGRLDLATVLEMCIEA